MRLSDVCFANLFDLRVAREPDYKAENAALRSLISALEHDSDNVLQRVAEAALSLCGGGSAGISLEDLDENGSRVFRWIAVAGAYKEMLGVATPGDFGPCGVAVDLAESQIFLDPARLYGYLRPVSPGVVEGIFVPYCENERTVGTLWVMTHEPGKAFDAEDRRLLEGLAEFAAAARRTLAARNMHLVRQAEHVAFQEQLAEERQQFRALLDEVPEHIVTLRGPELFYEFANRRFQEFAGEQEIAGRRVGEVWPVPPEHVEVLKEVFRTGEPVVGTEAPVPYPLEPHRMGYFDFAFRPRRGPDGTITGVLVHSLDVTEKVLARRELHRSEAKFRAAQESTPDGFTVLESVRDENGEIVDFRWTYANRAMEALTGDKPDEFIGRSLLEMRPAVLTTGLFEIYKRVTETGQPWTGEVHYPYDNRSVFLRITLVKVEDGFAAWTVDLTERKRIEERVAFMRNLTETVVDLRDPFDIIETAERMLGEHLKVNHCAYGEVDEDENTFTISRDWSSGADVGLGGVYRLSDFGRLVCDRLRSGQTFITRDTQLDVVESAAREAFADANVRATICCPLIRGGRLSAMIAIHSSEPREWAEDEIVTVQQVSDRMWAEVERARAERALRRLNEELDARVRERTQELAETVKEAEAFNYAISHDLRAPLRAIAATSRILLEEASEILDSPHRELLHRQAHNATRLGVLIDELLKLSRLARIEVRRTDFNLSELAEDVAEELERAGLGNACQFEIAPNLHGNGDPQLVRLVLANLLNNACKFSRSGQTVEVGRDASNVFYVRDQGVGFDMAYAHKVFLPFERLVTESEFPGTGIGLANVDRIVKRHGGRIWAESAPGAGATFFFTLE